MKLNVRLLTLTSFVSLMSLISLSVQAQVKIGQDAAPAKGAVLELNSATGTGNYIGGLRLPNVSITDLNAIPTGFTENTLTSGEKTALTGMVVYNTNTTTGVGIYYWDGTKWVKGTPTDLTKRDIVTGASSATATAPLVLTNNTAQTVGTANPSFTVNNTAPLWNANQLQGKAIHTTAPTDGQVLKWDNANSRWAPAADTNTFPALTSTTGLVITGSTTATQTVNLPAGTNGQVLKHNGTTWVAGTDNNTTYTNFVGSGTGAAAGLVPAPSTTAGTTKYLREDGTWEVPADANTTYTISTGAGAGAVTLTPSSGTAQTITININDADNIVGNEVTDAANGTLVRSGSGTAASPYKLERATISGDVTIAAASNAATVTGIQGRNVATTAPTNGQVLKWNGTAWAPAADDNTITNAWLTTGNAGSSPTTNFIGTTDNQALIFKVNNTYSGRLASAYTSFGYNALTTATGSGATAFGVNALSVNTGGGNSAFGSQSLAKNVGGQYNTAVGTSALSNHVTGNHNTAMGNGAMEKDSIGVSNTAIGSQALNSNKTGSNNTAIGYGALQVNTANGNTAVGMRALYSNNTGSQNTAVGDSAMFYNLGLGNTALGYKALRSTSTSTVAASRNVALGDSALLSITSGQRNIAIGNSAGSVISSGQNNIVIGTDASVPTATSSNQISIANLINATGATGVLTNSLGAGSVGIGTRAPATRLHLSGESAAAASLTMQHTVGTAYPYLRIVNTGANTLIGTMLFGRTTGMTTTDANASISAYSTAGTGGQLRFGTRSGTATATRMTVDSTGYVGINTTAPAERLHVSGTAYVSGNSWIGTTTAGNLGIGVAQGTAPISRVHIAGANQANSSLTMHSTSGSSYPLLRVANAGTSTTLGMLAFGRTNNFTGTTASHAYIYANAPTADRLVGNMYFGTGGATRMMIDTVGYVGIGTTAPAVKLHVATGGTSTAPIIGFRLTDGNHTVANRVLATDGTTGNATWKDLNATITKRDIVTGASSATATAPLVLANATAQTVGAANPSFTVNNTAPLWNANQLQGKAIHTTAPTDGQVLKWDNANSRWAPAADNDNPEPWYQMGTTNQSTANTQNSFLNAKVAIGTNNAANVNGVANGAQLTVAGGDAVINGITVGKGREGRSDNFAIGADALKANNGGWDNTAIGLQALTANTTGNFNTAVGPYALGKNIGGSSNTALGRNTLVANTNGNNNTAVGHEALNKNVGGIDNTAVGYYALAGNVSGEHNTAMGRDAGNKITGSYNTVVGRDAGNTITSGSGNIAIGNNAQVPTAGSNNQISIGNLIYGTNATGGGNGNVGIGANAPAQKLHVDGSTYIKDNAWVGYRIGVKVPQGTDPGSAIRVLNDNRGEDDDDITIESYKGTGTGDIYSPAFSMMSARGTKAAPINTGLNDNIGSIIFWPRFNGAFDPFKARISAICNGTNTIRLSMSAAQIGGDKAWTNESDGRLKTNVTTLKYGLSEVMKLKPVNYEMKDELGVSRIGFIAQEVKPIIPEVVVGNEGDVDKKDVLSVSYAEFAPVLTKAIQEQQQMIEAQQKIIEQLEARLKALEGAK
ncbi:MAG: tail fiber domain-containing protein [Dysgonamonadaceae bacterium]|nr:tail fiber domain-containing protein [Dysgonamonadaceae bacterium]